MNLLLLILPSPISRCAAISLASLSASRENILSVSNSDWREVRKILLMVVSISVGLVYSFYYSWSRGLQRVRVGAMKAPTNLLKMCRMFSKYLRKTHNLNLSY